MNNDVRGYVDKYKEMGFNNLKGALLKQFGLRPEIGRQKCATQKRVLKSTDPEKTK